MRFQDCIIFAKENPVCYIATMDGYQPRVRAFRLWFADERGFYFHTAASKDVCNQMKINPRVEVCFYAPGVAPDAGKMMRVTGEVEFVENIELKKRVLKERPFLKEIFSDKPEDPLLVIVHLYKGEVYFWTMGSDMRERDIKRVSFYGGK